MHDVLFATYDLLCSWHLGKGYLGAVRNTWIGNLALRLVCLILCYACVCLNLALNKTINEPTNVQRAHWLALKRKHGNADKLVSGCSRIDPVANVKHLIVKDIRGKTELPGTMLQLHGLSHALEADKTMQRNITMRWLQVSCHTQQHAPCGGHTNMRQGYWAFEGSTINKQAAIPWRALHHALSREQTHLKFDDIHETTNPKCVIRGKYINIA